MPVRAWRSAYMLSNDMNPGHEIRQTDRVNNAARAARRRLVDAPLALRASNALRRAAHRQAVDLERRLADTHGNALPILAADAHAAVELEVGAHHRHPRQRIRAVADQRRALDRIGKLAVLDLPRFRR